MIKPSVFHAHELRALNEHDADLFNSFAQGLGCSYSAKAILINQQGGYCCDLLLTKTKDAQLVAFILSRRVLKEVELLFIAVQPSQRRSGFASQLLKSLIEQSLADHAECLHLEVRESNQAARALYQRFGFTEVGRRKNYYPAADADQASRETAILYSLPLVK